MAKRKLFIDRHGNAKTILNDKIESIKDFGEMTITRAADVEFNNTSKEWEIIMPDGAVVGGAKKRKDAIALEITIVEANLKKELAQL
jgi:hypothetical protein